MEMAYRICCYVMAEAIFMLSLVGGCVVETFLGYKIYGDVYILRLEQMMHSSACMIIMSIFIMLMMVAVIKFVKPTIDAMVKGIQN